MKKYLLLLILLFQIVLLSQSPDTLWTKTFGGAEDDFGYFAEQTSDGGFIVTGWTQSFGAGLNDVWLIKTNSMGDTLWTKTFGGSEDDNISCVHQTSDGGYILFAETVSFSSNYWQAWLTKTDQFGDTSWTKLIGQNRHYFIQSGQELPGGDFIFVGYHKASGAGQEDIWLVKTNASGDTIWTKTFGGSESDISTSIRQTSDSGFIISAITKSSGAGNYDVWLIKTDSEGDTTWSKTYGGPDTDYANDVKQTNDNGFIIAGATRSFGHVNFYNDAWLIKVNSNGDTMWTKTFGSELHDGFSSVQQTLDGGYISAGYLGLDNFNTDAWLIKTDSSGDTLWTATYGGSNWDCGRSVEQTSDGGFIISGAYDATSTNSYDLYLIKLASDLNEIEHENLNYIPESFSLKQNYPNPFNPSTKITYQIPELSFVSIKVFDVLGNEMATLVSKELTTGEYEIEFKSTGLTSGIYFYQLKAGKFIQTKKMVFLK